VHTLVKKFGAGTADGFGYAKLTLWRTMVVVQPTSPPESEAAHGREYATEDRELAGEKIRQEGIAMLEA
jgi:hypothetical protein